MELKTFTPKKFIGYLTSKLSMVCIVLICMFSFSEAIAQPLTVAVDPVCSSHCCTSQPCNCSAGVIATGGLAPYSYTVISGGNIIDTNACVTGLCAGSYTFIVRDKLGAQVSLVVTVGGSCCKLLCRDTSFCYNVLDSAIHLVKPHFADTTGGGSGSVGGGDCLSDSIWSNAPGIYPVGTTVVKWYVAHNGLIDSCTQNVIRNAPSIYNISFFTSPAMVAGVINICNGQSITFTNTSTGTTGQLWNFGNGYYSSNAIHTEPASHYPPGTYYDTLTVFDACGAPHDTAFRVVVDSASGPDIYCISVVCPGDTVTYHTHANCSIYTWSVTGGTFLTPPTSSSDSATVIWGAGPHGTITLNVSGCTPALTCPLGTTKIIDIVPATLPVAGDTVVCAGSKSCYAVECIPGNNHGWELNPANAGVITGQGTCEVCIQWNPNFFGIVTLVVNYNNILTGAGCNLPTTCSTHHGCGGSGTITIHVKPIFGISGPAKVCPNSLSAPFNGMNLTNNTIEPATTWKLVTPIPTTIFYGSSGLLNSYLWSAGPGIYHLTAYAPANIYCNDSAVTTVEVVNIIAPNTINGPDTVCANVPTIYNVIPNMVGVTYTWTVIGGIIIGPSTGNSVSISWSPGGGTVSVIQTLSAAPFCVSSSSASRTVSTWPNFTLPVITPSNPTVCLNSTITYSIPLPLISNGTYTWSVVPATAGNIITANGTNTITIKWINAGGPPIFVKLKINRCYNDSVMLPINLLPLPGVPNISYLPANPCKNTPVQFTTTSPGTWNWSFGDLGLSNSQNPLHTYSAAGNFNVQLYVTNLSGCSDTANTTITVEDIPVIPVITGPDSVCLNSVVGYSFAEPLFPGASYTWSLSAPALGIISSQGNNFLNLKWTSPGTDTVKVHVQATCLDTIIKYVVVINPLPTASISSPSTACEGATVTYVGSGGVNYNWSFGGGSPASSILSTENVIYNLFGTYTTTLAIVDANGCTANATTTITIHPLPLAIINGPPTICAFPGGVTLTAVAAPGYTFLWSPFGQTTPTITNNISSLTTFSCVVTNGYGCTKQSNYISVDSLSCTPVHDTCVINDSINFTYTPPICLTQTYTKIYASVHTGWYYGDGGSDGPISPVTHTFPYPGIFPVTVAGIGYGTYPHGGVCSSPIGNTHNVTIPFDAHYDFAFQCNGSNVMQTVFTNTSLYLGVAGSYTWQWYDVSTASVLSSVPFPGPITMTPGTHIVNLNIFDVATGATCTITKTLNVPAPILASFTVSAPLCVGAPNTFTNTSFNIGNQTSMSFNNGNGGFATTSPASIPYANSGNFTAILIVTDKYGCNSTASQPVSVTAAGSGTLTVGPLGCDSVQLTASGPGPFTWNIITPPPSPNNPAYVKTSGFYSVTGNGVNGCPYTAGPVQVTVKKSPVVVITGKTQYCQGEALDIKTTTAGASYAWNKLPSAVVIGTSANLNVILTSPGTFTYKVTVTSANGCTGSATYVITVDPVPSSAVIDSSGSLTLCQGDSVMLFVNPAGNTYLWSKSPAPPLSSPQNTNPNLWVTQSGTYSVIVQTASGCAYPAIAPVNVFVNPLPLANITGDTVLCEGETLQLLTTQGQGTYAWTGPTSTGITNPFVKTNMQLADAGIYSVIVTNVYGCTKKDSITVIVNPTPATPFIISNPGGVLCEGQLYNLSVVGPLAPPVVYNWSTGQMGTSINAAMAGNYNVTATNQFGCSSTSNTITIHPLPDLSCVPSGCYEFCNECISVVIPGPFGLTSYTWQKLVGNTFVFYSATQNMTVFPPGGVFRLIGANQWGCADSSDTLRITFRNCCPLLPPPSCLDTCVNFNTNNLMGWQPSPSAPNVGLSVTNTNSQGGVNDYYILASDLAGPSQLLSGSQLFGKWCCGSFCYDYKVFDDGVAGSINVNPQFAIKSGTLGFTFTSSTVVTENSPWQRICAPISDCNPPPISGAGTWAPIAGTVMTDWTTVLSNVTEVLFKVDYSVAVGETSGFDNVCIHSGVPQISAGNDTTICAGQYITLHVTGCTGTPQWQEIVPGGVNFNIGGGQNIDVHPTQNTCYMVTCCGAGACCCDTDTVCITVRPIPVLHWSTNYPTVCQNSAPVYLDSTNILVFKNNVYMPLSQAGGTGYFSGVGVVGNYFTPSTVGTFIISYTYTDSSGCSTTINDSIIVISCCTHTCHVNAGNDTTICAGSFVLLHATGCTGIPKWYAIQPGGVNFFINDGNIDVFPTQNTCYMVICCFPGTTCCCDTDTICITVRPIPVLHWSTKYPTVCQNSASVYLDSTNILVFKNNVYMPLSQAGGTGYFSGVGVAGNYFTPSTVGTFIISYTYTDSSGCSTTINDSIIVISCCTHTCHVNAGPDQTICAGGVAILNATGCTGIPKWYEIKPNGVNFFINDGNIDVFPTQNTCYMVICCFPGTQCCCDTDTVCITVRPIPVLHWSTKYPTVCQNSAPVYLDSTNILVFKNNVYMPLSQAGGTGYFSGVGVVGNYFTPSTVGTFIISYTYTDSSGCSTTINDSIIVIACCTHTCHVNAGPDQTICAGGVAILNATGCTGSPHWYAIQPDGSNFFINDGNIDVFPTQNTCYMVICCFPGTTCCCDTDTICITVRPIPVLHWSTPFTNVCLNSAPVYLDSTNILVLVNNVYVPLSQAGGTGYFSGTGVVGNYFYPTTLGTFMITYTYTDIYGCTATITNTITVIPCGCVHTCQINAGPDQNICVGGTATLNVTGCTGTPSWYQLGNIEGPQLIGQGPTINVTPQVSTCYIVICCFPGTNCCCDTDTVCVNIHPAPNPQWEVSFVSICQNSAPFYLDASNIFNISTTPWTPILLNGGSGYFGGNGVIGNYFYPTTLGIHTLYYYYTDSNGCQGVATNTINVISCGCGPCFNPGAELIKNGGFESGNTSFFSQLAYSCACGTGTYCITNNSINKCATNLSVTSTSIPTGNNYMVVDGDASSPRTIWQQGVTIVNTNNYIFSFWIHPAVSTAGNSQKPNINITVNANVILSLQGVSLTNGWTKYQAVISGISGTTLEIHQTNFGSTGMDYGIDDISLKQCVRAINVIFNPTINVSCAGGNDGAATAVVTGGTLPYTYQWSNGVTIESVTGLKASPYTVTVIDGNGCNIIATAVITEPPPVTVGPVTGVFTGCTTSAGIVNYSVASIAGALSYDWTVPNGMTITSGQGTAAITTAWNSAAIQKGIIGQLCASVLTNCGVSVPTCNAIDFSSAIPVTPPSISGPQKVCPGDHVIYSIAAVPRTNQYIWSLPTGIVITGGSGTNIISADVTSAFAGGNISVIAENVCGNSPARIQGVIGNILPASASISGPTNGLCNLNGVIYTATAVTGALSYQWTVPAGATIVGSSTGSSIVVNFGTITSGTITVTAINNCGAGAIRSLTVTGTPTQPATVSGPTNLCSGSQYIYTIPTVPGAGNYAWTVSSRLTILSGQGSKNLSVLAGATGTNITVNVNATNACGTSPVRVLAGIIISGCARVGDANALNLLVYPNPVSDLVNINFNSEKTQDYHLSLMDATGRIVIINSNTAEEGENKLEMNVKGLASGIYMLQFRLGNQTEQVRICVE